MDTMARGAIEDHRWGGHVVKNKIGNEVRLSCFLYIITVLSLRALEIDFRLCGNFDHSSSVVHKLI